MSARDHMAVCLTLARVAAEAREVPVGCVITDGSGEVIVKTRNRVEELSDPLAHAELLAIQQALKLCGEKYLEDCTLYVTLEPCPLCAAAIAATRIKTVVFGAYDEKSGGVEHGTRTFTHTHHKPEVIGGVREAECKVLLQDFFLKKR